MSQEIDAREGGESPKEFKGKVRGRGERDERQKETERGGSGAGQTARTHIRARVTEGPRPGRGRQPLPHPEPTGLTMVLHLLQHSNPTLLLPWVVDEDSLEGIARTEDLLGEDVEQQVVDSQVLLDTILPHLAQGQVDEVHVASLVHVVLPKVLHGSHKAGLVPGHIR